ncbi:transporter substrate-binding domain-containing protein [Deferribacteraceae bacterium V6Fe1]|nr:transporter substrate-binding domain-containing protein [Deferribacteraceae bacterium V6Fe1]
MKNKLTITLLIFITIAVNSFAERLKVGFWDNKPLSYLENGEYKGFHVDIFKYIAQKNNIDYEFVYGSWSELYSDISKGKIDVFFPIGYAEYRLQYMDYSKFPIFENWGQIVTQKGNNINSFYDLNGKTIAVQFNDIFLMAMDGLAPILEKLDIRAKYYFVDNYNEAVDAVLNKNVDTALIARNYTFSLKNSDLKLTNIIVKPVKSHFAYKKGLDKRIVKKIDDELSNLLSDENSYYYNRLQYFSEGYYLHNPILTFLERNYIKLIILFFSFIIIAFLIIFIFNYKLAKATTQLKNERKKLVKILNNLTEPIILFNGNLQVDFFNKAAKNTFDSLDIGKTISDFTYPIQDNNKNIKFEDIIFSKELKDYYLIKDTLKGDIIAEISITKIQNEHNNNFDYVVMINDITSTMQNIQIQTKIDKLETIGKIAAGIAHDFNNYLGAISNYVMAIKAKGNFERELPKIENLIQKSRHLTKQLLTFAKGSSLEIQNINICKIVKDAAEFVLKGSSINLNFNIEYNDLCANADENFITQVITNIVINAKQSMDDRGEIDISINTVSFGQVNEFNILEGDYVKISVRDYGTGIPEDIAKDIFEPFFTTKPSGSGLGLATAYSIVKQHNGHITFKNLDKGCVFEIYLPKTECKINNNNLSDNSNLSKKLNILYMDDEDDLRDSFKTMLELFHCNVTVTRNGEETLKEVENKEFDIIVLDLTIKGGLSGEATIKKLKDKGINSFFVVSSGYSDGETITNYKKYGFDFYLPKPFSLENLKNMLNSVQK